MNNQKLKRNTSAHVNALLLSKKKKKFAFPFFMIYHPLGTTSTTLVAEASTSLAQQYKVEN